ncbi:unnamed protein product [Discula destructiva]
MLDLSSWSAANIGGLSLFLVVALWLRYTSWRDAFATQSQTRDGKSVPSTFPYIVPLLGSLPIAYLWGPKAFVLNSNNFFQSTNPVLVKILTEKFYVVRGPENVKALFKSSWACTSIPFVKFALGHAFGLPAKALSLYDRDDSGSGHAPHPDSTVDARNRIDYRVYQSLLRFLEGKGLVPFWDRFAQNITQQMFQLHERMGSDWEHHDDLMKVVGDEATICIVNALCGPHLLRLNPNFLQDYWCFDRNLQTYLQGKPRFLAPRAYAARKRVLNAVKVWQQHARDHFDASAIDPGGDDPFWGSSFFRERHQMFSEMDGFDFAAIASEDFGAVWAARNAISAASWAIFNLYRDPELLAKVRTEVDACALKDANGHVRFDIDQLLHLPVLQAVYAETLRLRMHFYIIRMPDRVDVKIQDWVIPKGKVIVTSTTVAHMNADVWRTGVNNEHPVDQFWVGRFLEYAPGASASPKFSTKGLEGSWIPYGGGPRQCPGRHFAKRQILLTIALWVSLCDCEISAVGKDVKEDFTVNGFGSGMSHPAGKVPMRMRRRETKRKWNN